MRILCNLSMIVTRSKVQWLVKCQRIVSGSGGGVVVVVSVMTPVFSNHLSSINFFILFYFFFLATLSLHCHTRAFSSCGI